MKFFYLSSLLSIVTYVSAISECPVGGASAGVYGPGATVPLPIPGEGFEEGCPMCVTKGYLYGEICAWQGIETFLCNISLRKYHI
ncbi:hypothetical protein BJ944DRAFT_253729 [Cunninghamella echinulata]|nr:hypothetical protein BJ944DRAFT_253729 [Cunninghamella echinulata]